VPKYGEVVQLYDGEWNIIPRKNFYRACCDCGLVHREEHRVRKGKIEYRVWGDKAATRAERRATGKGKK